MTTRAAWFATNILPHEPKLRAWLRKAGWSAEEVEDLVQESYARIAALPLDKIDNPTAYLYRVARNIASDHLRRRRVVSIQNVADMSRLDTLDPSPDPEEQLSAYEDLMRLKAAIERLPARCRAVFLLRKIEGLSQAEICARLGLSENTVEKYIARGVRLCAAMLTKNEGQDQLPGLLSVAFRKNGVSGGKR